MSVLPSWKSAFSALSAFFKRFRPCHRAEQHLENPENAVRPRTSFDLNLLLNFFDPVLQQPEQGAATQHGDTCRGLTRHGSSDHLIVFTERVSVLLISVICSGVLPLWKSFRRLHFFQFSVFGGDSKLEEVKDPPQGQHSI